MAQLIEVAPEKVVAIYAHPDDPDVACGGTLARWAKAGCEVHVVICAQGEKGTTDAETDPQTLAVARVGESAAAGHVLGVAEQHLLGHLDGELENDSQLRSELVEIVRRVRPDAVICPDPEAVFFGGDYFNHRDHRTIGWASLDSISPAAALPLYFPQHGAAHQVSIVYLSGTLKPDVWVDVEDSMAEKIAAVLCHASQSPGEEDWVADVLRRRAQDAGRQAGVRWAEGFRRLALT